MNQSIVYISSGKLYYKEFNKNPVEIESKFINELKQNYQNSFKNSNWKNNDSDDPYENMKWGTQVLNSGEYPLRVTAIAKGTKDGDIYYSVKTSHVNILLKYNLISKEELRLIHSNEFKIIDLSVTTDDKVLCSFVDSNNTRSLVVIDESNRIEITEGPSLDEAPYTLDDNNIYYQSAGIMSSRDGLNMGSSHYSLQKLNREDKKIETILESEYYDFIFPKINKNNELYFIKRPYELPEHLKDSSILDYIFDIILFPFRLLRAIFYFLNKMSLIFSNKPLTTAGKKVEVDNNFNHMLLRGKFIDLDKLQKENKGSKFFSLVPSSWELVKKSGEKYSIIAKNVVSYDISNDEEIIYTNGSTIFYLDKNGKRKKLVNQFPIESILFV